LIFKEGLSSAGPPDFSRRFQRPHRKSIASNGNVNSSPRPSKAKDEPAGVNR
jgi:hypothetical protein